MMRLFQMEAFRFFFCRLDIIIISGFAKFFPIPTFFYYFFFTSEFFSLLVNFILQNEFCDSSCSQNSYSFSLLLEPRSLLVLKDNLYTDYLHSIDEIHEDIIDGNIRNLHCLETKYASGQRLSRSTRISLTIRNVPRCSNFKLKF